MLRCEFKDEVGLWQQKLLVLLEPSPGQSAFVHYGGMTGSLELNLSHITIGYKGLLLKLHCRLWGKALGWRE